MSPSPLREFGLVGLLVSAAILLAGGLAGGLLVLVWARLSDTPWRALGFVREPRWPLVIAGGVVAGVTFKLLMKAVVMPLLGAPPVNAAYQHLVGNTAALPAVLFLVIVGAGFGEEIVWRGYFFERLGRLLPDSAAGRLAIIAMSSVLFGLAHYADQGIAGGTQAIITGAVFGSIFMATRRIWFPIVMHAAFDVTAVFIIYWDLETRIAESIFR